MDGRWRRAHRWFAAGTFALRARSSQRAGCPACHYCANQPWRNLWRTELSQRIQLSQGADSSVQDEGGPHTESFELASYGPVGSRRQDLSLHVRRGCPRSGEQSRPRDCPLQPADRRYRHSARESRTKFAWRRHRTSAGHARRTRGYWNWHRQSRRRCGWHDERGWWRWHRYFRNCVVHRGSGPGCARI